MSKDKDENNHKELVIHTPSVTNSLAILDRMNDIESFADKIKNSKYGKLFKKKPDDEDEQVDTMDIISNIMLGQEMGIPMLASVMFGKKLNQNSYLSVLKGKSLGLDPMTSLNNIYPISTSNGVVLSVGVHIISKAILDSGTSISIIKDFEPVYKYTFTKDKVTTILTDAEALDESGKLRSNLFVVDAFTDMKEAAKAKEEGKLLIRKVQVDTITTGNFKRPSKNIDIDISYTLNDATEAGLYHGTDSRGNYVDGKDNWNKHPKTMLRNRMISTAGRIVAADYIQGMYIPDEIINMDNVNVRDITHIQQMEDENTK